MNLDPIFREEISFDELISSFVFAFNLPNNDILLGYIAAESHSLLFRLKENQKEYWNEPFTPQIISPNNSLDPVSFQDIVLFFDNKGDLILFFIEADSDTEYPPLYLAISHSYGKTWGDIHPISEEEIKLTVYSKPIIIKNGINAERIILPVIQNNQHSMFLISSDFLKSWQFSLYLEPNEDTMSFDDEALGCTINPTLIENLDGTLQAYCHIIDWPGVYTAQSMDSGETWEETQALQNVNIDASMPYRVIRLENNDQELSDCVVLLGWQHSLQENLDLVLYISEENGNFSDLLINLDEINIGQFQVCEIIQDNEANLHILYQKDEYTLKHSIFPLESLKNFRTNGR